MIDWDETTDLVIVGSGGGGLTAALTAARLSMTTVVLEKGARFGGSTAMSGGILWLPGNPVLRRGGRPDSLEAGRAYLDAVVGDHDVACTPERREAFLQAVDPMVEMLEAEGLSFFACHGYSDYYDERPGGRREGRAIGARMIGARRLGDLADRLMLLPGWNVPVNTDEFADLSRAGRTVRGKIMAARVALRVAVQRLYGAPIYARGAALQARMLLAVRSRGVDLRGGVGVAELVAEDGRIAGVRARDADGHERMIGARRGVLIAAGGFARDGALRRQFQPGLTEASWTMANAGDTGEMITEAVRHGAAVHDMDQAWWIPVSLKANGQIAGFHSPQEMQKPYCMAVNAAGERFVNEAASYMEIGQAMFARGAIPAWVIMDARHRSYYPWGAVPPGVTPSSWLKSGYLKRADTIEELARQCGVHPAGLARTVERFNGFAKTGRDEDFGRGARAYDRYHADPRVKPNPALGPIEQGPFSAVAIVPGDVGTAGGLMADEYGRVLRPDGSVLQGVYACGNSAAPVFGKVYPGPGASIAASFVFGFIAARHAAASDPELAPETQTGAQSCR